MLRRLLIFPLAYIHVLRIEVALLRSSFSMKRTYEWYRSLPRLRNVQDLFIWNIQLRMLSNIGFGQLLDLWRFYPTDELLRMHSVAFESNCVGPRRSTCFTQVLREFGNS